MELHVPYGNPADREPEIATVRAIYDAFARRDVEAALAHIHEDVVFAPTGTQSLVKRDQPYVGHDGVRQYFRDAARVWDDLRLHADDFRAAVGGVVVFGHVEGTVIGGGAFHSRVIWIWRLRDGKAASMHVNPVGSPPPA